jgi:hypothetical protein
MMRKLFIYFYIIIPLLLMNCGKTYQIKYENPVNPSLSSYKTVFIGWLDFNETKWKQYGFKSPKEWTGVIANLNIDSLQAYVKSQLSGRRINGAKSKSQNPGKEDIYITFYLKKHYIATGLNRIQELYLIVNYIDMKKGKIVYSASVMVDSQGFGTGNFTLEGQLNFAMKNLAQFIASKL